MSKEKLLLVGAGGFGRMVAEQAMLQYDCAFVDAGLSQSNYWKYENHTSGGMKNELPGVPKSNGSNTEKINKTDNSETDLIYPAELQEEEQYRRYFKEALELEILEQGYSADKAVLYEILELLVETVTSRKKFLRICGEDKPKTNY